MGPPRPRRLRRARGGRSTRGPEAERYSRQPFPNTTSRATLTRVMRMDFDIQLPPSAFTPSADPSHLRQELAFVDDAQPAGRS